MLWHVPGFILKFQQMLYIPQISMSDSFKFWIHTRKVNPASWLKGGIVWPSLAVILPSTKGHSCDLSERCEHWLINLSWETCSDIDFFFFFFACSHVAMVTGEHYSEQELIFLLLFVKSSSSNWRTSALFKTKYTWGFERKLSLNSH